MDKRKRIGLFSSVDPYNEDQVKEKLDIVAQWLIVLSFIVLILVVIMLLWGLIMSNTVFKMMDNAGKVGLFYLMWADIFLSLFRTALAIWYVRKIQEQIRKDEVPNPTLAYVFFALTIIASIITVLGNGGLLSYLENGFSIYLWYSVVSLTKSLERLKW